MAVAPGYGCRERSDVISVLPDDNADFVPTMVCSTPDDLVDVDH